MLVIIIIYSCLCVWIGYNVGAQKQPIEKEEREMVLGEESEAEIYQSCAEELECSLIESSLYGGIVDVQMTRIENLALSWRRKASELRNEPEERTSDSEDVPETQEKEAEEEKN